MGDLKSTSRLKINQGKELTKENQLEGTYRPITVERKERKKKDWIRPDGGGLAHPALTAGGESDEPATVGHGPHRGGDRTGPAWRHRGCWRRGKVAQQRWVAPPAHRNDMHVRRIWAAQVPVEIRGGHIAPESREGKARPGEQLPSAGLTGQGRGGGARNGLATTQVVVATVGGEGLEIEMGRWCWYAPGKLSRG